MGFPTVYDTNSIWSFLGRAGTGWGRPKFSCAKKVEQTDGRTDAFEILVELKLGKKLSLLVEKDYS